MKKRNYVKGFWYFWAGVCLVVSFIPPIVHIATALSLLGALLSIGHARRA